MKKYKDPIDTSKVKVYEKRDRRVEKWRTRLCDQTSKHEEVEYNVKHDCSVEG